MSLWSLLLPDKWDLYFILFQLFVALCCAVFILLVAGIVILIGKVVVYTYGKIERFFIRVS
mgnify:CR=1 FL=1|jgi:hypothetical protein